MRQALRYRIAMAARALHERGLDRATTLIHRAIARRAQRLDELDFSLRRTVQLLIETQAKRLADASRRLHANDLRLRLAHGRHSGHALEQRFVRAMSDRLWQSRRRFESLEVRLRQLSPLAVLGRGYAIVQNAQGQALRSASETGPGEDLSVRLSRGRLSAKVIQTRDEN
jgi:exodeoxyribonuclease VII large subunit